MPLNLNFLDPTLPQLLCSTPLCPGARPASADRFDPVIPGLHDYQEIAPGSVLPRNFEDTRRTQTFNVPIYDDNVTEGVEEFNITLSLQDPRLSGTVIVRPAVATVRIRDNDCKFDGFPQDWQSQCSCCSGHSRTNISHF